MDAARLIAIVQEYEEIYNLKHLDYSNQQIRDNIWEQIGTRFNKNGTACKERWTRIRDNHRKALNLRKTKSGQAASKIKPPKFSQKLAFLTPYLNDEEGRRSNLSPNVIDNDETKLETRSDSTSLNNNVLSDAPSPLSTESVTSTRSVGRKSSFAGSQVSQGPTAATVLKEYLTTRTAQNSEDSDSDSLLEFFNNMVKTVNTFPLQDQIQSIAQLFQMVNSVEMRLATTPNLDSNPMASGSNVRIVSNVLLPAPTSSNSIFPQTSRSNTMMFTTPMSKQSPTPSSSTPKGMPALNETMSEHANIESLLILSSHENVNNTEHLDSMDQNTQILGQYLHFNNN